MLKKWRKKKRKILKNKLDIEKYKVASQKFWADLFDGIFI
jgi:hypothetical protein